MTQIIAANFILNIQRWSCSSSSLCAAAADYKLCVTFSGLSILFLWFGSRLWDPVLFLQTEGRQNVFCFSPGNSMLTPSVLQQMNVSHEAVHDSSDVSGSKFLLWVFLCVTFRHPDVICTAAFLHISDQRSDWTYGWMQQTSLFGYNGRTETRRRPQEHFRSLEIWKSFM